MKLNQSQLTKASSYRGASMGRLSLIPADNIPIKYYMVKLKWIDGDYDFGGAYWGNSRNGDNIYWAQSDIEVETRFATGYSTDRKEKSQIFVRAKSRNEAKEKVKNWASGATFYR